MNINEEFAEHLNALIRKSGRIQKFNKEIWTVLNDGSFTNEEWWQFIANMLDKEQQHPNSLTSRAQDHIEAALRVTKGRPGYERTLDKKSRHSLDPFSGLTYQQIAWALIQDNREQYNRIKGIDLPNDDSSREVTKQAKPQTGTKEYRRWRIETNVTYQQNIFEIID